MIKRNNLNYSLIQAKELMFKKNGYFNHQIQKGAGRMIRTAGVIRIIVMILLIFSTVEASDKIKLDIKVPLGLMAEVTPIQISVSYFLLTSDWATVTDFGEEYSVWITEYDKSTNIFNQQVVTLLIEVRSPAMLLKGSLIKSEKVKVRYRPGKHIEFESEYANNIIDNIGAMPEDLMSEMYIVGKEIEKTLKGILK